MSSNTESKLWKRIFESSDAMESPSGEQPSTETSRYDELRHPDIPRLYVCAVCPFKTARVDRWRDHVDTVHAEHRIDPEDRSEPRNVLPTNVIDPASRSKPRKLTTEDHFRITDRRKPRPRPQPPNAVIDRSKQRRQTSPVEQPGSYRFSPEKLKNRRR